MPTMIVALACVAAASGVAQGRQRYLSGLYSGHTSQAIDPGVAVIDHLREKTVSFRATHENPGRVLEIESATVSGRGADVRVRLVAPILSDGQPDTSGALLIYGSNGGCRSTYEAAEAQSVTGQPAGFISNAYATADVANPPFGDPARYAHGAFTFDVTTNTVILTASGSSPFFTACVMLYSGQPGTLTPANNVALLTIQAPLHPGAGPPDNQP